MRNIGWTIGPLTFREARIFRGNCDGKGLWDLVAMSGPWDKRLGAGGWPSQLAAC